MSNPDTKVPWGLTSHVKVFLLFWWLEEPAITEPLVLTFTGAPSNSGSPAFLYSKTSNIFLLSLKEEGTLYNTQLLPASKSLTCPGCLHLRLTVRDLSITVWSDAVSTLQQEFRRAGDKGREDGGGDPGEKEANEEVAGKRNFGSLTPSEYGCTSLSTLPSWAWPGRQYTRPVMFLSRVVATL